ncbi:hypothetical protein C882_3917 [Caenispirillum salinarum AK4]|uniref:Type I secretion outer membrane protein, TolC n=1 Tax=Caenispirillum salinarum AK4 TaxID=1238182 RepID=K9H3B7_9PROT|nr:hypothetical protein C882_3917 [Caenispirillum salinarum AK4]
MGKVLRTSSAVYFCALAVMGSAQAQAAPLAEEVTSLLAGNPRIEAARNNLRAAEKGIDEAFGDYLPRLDLRADMGHLYADSPTRRTQGEDQYAAGRETATLTLTQKIWDGGAREAEYQSAQLQRDAAASAVNATVQEVILEAATAYMTVLRQTRLLELSRENERNIMEQLNLENERVQRGSGIAVDVLQAKSRLQIAKERRVAVEGALRDAQARYLQVFGTPAVVDSMTRPRPPVDLLPETLDAAIEIARAENPAVTSGAKQIAIADERRDLAESGYYPRFNLELSGTYENDVDPHLRDAPGMNREFSALVTANWNIFNGFATKAAVARTAFEHAAARDTQAQTLRRVSEQVRVAWEALQTARERVSLLGNAVTIAQEVYDARLRLRQSGRDTALNVLDAENEVFTARINYTSALFEAQIATYRLLAAMGRLDPEVLDQVAAGSGEPGTTSLAAAEG